jgi:cell division protein FtsB
MPLHDRRRRRFRQIPVLLFCLMTTGYFCVHALKGKHGLEARSRLLLRESSLERDLASLEAVRLDLAREVARLEGDETALDDVDVAARKSLGFAHPADLIVMQPVLPRTIDPR